MLTKIKALILAVSTLLFFSAPVAVYAAADIQGSACSGATNLEITDAGGSCPSGEDASGFNTILTRIINIFSVIVGVVAVIMLIVGGFRYITSGGSAEKVTAAKNTILYALIGLVIVALAQIIVKFVLTKTTSGVS